MRHMILGLSTALVAFPAVAHEAGVSHGHPHGLEWLVALTGIVAAARAIAVLRAALARANKRRDHK